PCLHHLAEARSSGSSLDSIHPLGSCFVSRGPRCIFLSCLAHDREEFSILNKGAPYATEGELQSLTKGALSMLEYINNTRGVADSLAEDLQPISDEDLIGHILSGLDSSHGGFARAFMVAADCFSVDDMVGLLLQEEAH
ncbi:hypothetical protein LINGRAHAP2_LOCUS30835, partial [Linum grandiflorum]